MRASVLAEKVFFAVMSLDARLRDPEAWALEALSLDRASLPALQALGWVRILRGMPIEDLLERQHEMADTVSPLDESMERLTGIRCAFRGEVVAARRTFARLLALADDRGEGWSHGALYAQLTEVELRAGDCVATQRLLDEWDVPHESTVETLAVLARLTAVLAVHRGLPEAADGWARKAIAIAETSRSGWDLLEAKRARGIAALFAGHPDRAVDDLLAVWDHTRREGVDDPGAFPVAPDLVEALVALGQIDEAAAVTERLSRLATEQVHPWGLATAKRCRALVRLASDPADGEAFSALTEAASDYGDLGLRFDHARSLLIVGRAQRRARRWGDASRSLERALASFDGMGAPGWADQARSELDRVGARRPAAAGTLTAAEERVVELAAEGRSNKEIAHALSVGVHTVEVQLSRAYAKLGVQSRAQLARRLAARPTQ
jgi:DNA-binding CsgD family transcriptional regulator